MEKYIKNIEYIDKDTNECEITLNDGEFEFICFSPNYHKNHLSHIYAFLPQNIMIADNKECFIKKNNNGYFAYHIQGQFVSRIRREIKVGKFLIQLEDNEIPQDIKDGEYIQFDCQRLDFFSVVIK